MNASIAAVGWSQKIHLTIVSWEFNWIVESSWDIANQRWQHKYSIFNKKKLLGREEKSNSYYLFTSTMPEGVNTHYAHSIDSLSRLMAEADSSKRLYPIQNKQLALKHFFGLIDINPLDSLEFSSLILSIEHRINLLKAKNTKRWEQRIEELNSLHREINDLYKGCSAYQFPDELNREKDSVSYLYFDRRNNSFIRLSFLGDSTIQMHYRPTYFQLLSYNEKAKESCKCCGD